MCYDSGCWKTAHTDTGQAWRIRLKAVAGDPWQPMHSHQPKSSCILVTHRRCPGVPHQPL